MYLTNAIKKLKNISIIRKKIDLFQIDSTKTIQYYSNINTNLLNHISYFLTISTESEISKMIFSYINLLKDKENAGMQRAVLNNTFTAISNIDRLRKLAFSQVIKIKIISNIKETLGYGGLIHNFKNFLLRGNIKYKIKFNEQYKQLLKQIKQYEQLSIISKQELIYLNKIKSTFTHYKNNLIIIEKNKNKLSIKDIDKLVQIDDTQTILNIQSLDDNIMGQNAMIWYKASTKKINIIKNIERHYSANIDGKMKKMINDITNEQIFNFILISIIFIFIFTLSIILILNITTSIKKITQGLVNFSDYIRGTTDNIKPIKIDTNDEFGEMAKIVNKNIQKTKIYLDKKVQEETDKNTLRLKEFNIELEKKIKIALQENTKQLQLLQEQNKLTAMGEMIGAIAHQWRQPLNELGINIQNLEYDYIYEEIDEKFIKEFIEKNYNTIQYMSNTINDFKNFFRIDKTKSNFNVKETTKTVYTMVSAQFERYEIIVNISGNDFLYNGFQSEFQQVILNLLNNAKDALLENQIKKPQIDIKFENNVVTIQDNAGGIPKNIIDRIFEPYYTTKEQGKGTGIGLYMSKTIIEKNMNSKLEVENKNDGACFKITLN